MAQALVRGLSLALLIGATGAGSPVAQENVKLYAVPGKYEDIKTDLTNAIVNQGPVFVGDISEMLKRTGADVDSTNSVYRVAEYLTFCSAKLSRATSHRSSGSPSRC